MKQEIVIDKNLLERIRKLILEQAMFSGVSGDMDYTIEKVDELLKNMGHFEVICGKCALRQASNKVEYDS